jgi:F0F1-type ATP synthase membrane subunit b/b'
MIEALFDRLHKQAELRVDKEIKTYLAQIEKQKQEVIATKDKRVKELLTKALKQLLIDKTITKPEAQLMVKKYGLSIPKPAPRRAVSTGGCGSMATGHTGNRC